MKRCKRCGFLRRAGERHVCTLGAPDKESPVKAPVLSVPADGEWDHINLLSEERAALIAAVNALRLAHGRYLSLVSDIAERWRKP